MVPKMKNVKNITSTSELLLSGVGVWLREGEKKPTAEHNEFSKNYGKFFQVAYRIL